MIESIQKALGKYWGFDGFLPLQKQAMECIGRGTDSIVVLPTGGGKSLCFQAPAVIMPGLAVVVSPLISLMKDQVDTLSECGIPAGRIDSSLSFDKQKAVLAKIHNKKLKLLYLAPERLVSDSFLEVLRKVELSFIAIDEAHCVSMWGHDFRPEYLAHKRKTLQQFRHHRILIAVPEKSLREGAKIGDNVLVYKTALKIKPLMETLERIRVEKVHSASK